MNCERFVPGTLIVLAIAAAVPAFAQDQGNGDETLQKVQNSPATVGSDAASEMPPADASAGTSGGDAAADANSADSSGTDISGTGSSSDATASFEAPAGDAVAANSGSTGQRRYVYAGADYVFLHSALSKDKLENALGNDDFDSNFYRVRVGMRLLPQLGIEGQFGVKNEDGNASDKVETKDMYGISLVPTGNLFRVVEISVPLGYSHLKLRNDNGAIKLDSFSAGINLEVPVYVNPDSRMPDVRIGGGATMFYVGNDARTYGYHAGIRLDFKI